MLHALPAELRGGGGIIVMGPGALLPRGRVAVACPALSSSWAAKHCFRGVVCLSHVPQPHRHGGGSAPGPGPPHPALPKV